MIDSVDFRHPWESARLTALRTILKQGLDIESKRFGLCVLDIGCGDGFAVTELIKDKNTLYVDAIDSRFTAKQLAEFSTKYSHITFHDTYSSLRKNSYNTIFLLDVIEHVEEDDLFLRRIMNDFALPGALILITLPAFNSFFCSHDKKLGHYKRYNLVELKTLLNGNGLQIVSSGYLFSTLLLPRLFSVVIEKVFGYEKKNTGVGRWNHGFWVSRITELALRGDNAVILFVNRFGIKIPGLTVWALCKKQQ